MWLAKIVRGREEAPYLYEIDNFEIRRNEYGQLARYPVQPRVWSTKTGAAAISQTPWGAVASAKVRLEQERMKAESILERAKLKC